MILPTKYVSVRDSYLYKAIELSKSIDKSITINTLYKKYQDLYESNYSEYTKVVILMYSLQLIEYSKEKDGTIKIYKNK